MKMTFTSIALSGMLAGGMLLTSCTTSEGRSSADGAIARYEIVDEIETIPVCKATVEEKYPCYSIFRTADGHKFSIGSPGAPNEVIHFLTTLKQGQAYEFPVLFLDYQKSIKTPNGPS